MASKNFDNEIDSNNNSPGPTSITITPSTPTALTPKKVLPTAYENSPKRKIFPPVVTPISDQLMRERNTSKVSKKLIQSLNDHRLLNEVIELKGELNETKLKLEDYQAENSQLKKGSSELKAELTETKLKLEGYQAENSQWKKGISELKADLTATKLKLEGYQAENSQLKKGSSECQVKDQEINDLKRKLEVYQAEISQLKGSSECQKKNQEELKDEVNVLKRNLEDYQKENSQLKKEISELHLIRAKQAPKLKEVTVTATKASMLRAQASLKRKPNSDQL